MHGRYMSSVADYTKEYSKKLKYNAEDDDLISNFDAEQSMRSYSQAREKSCWRLSCNLFFFFLHNFTVHLRYSMGKPWQGFPFVIMDL